MVTLLCILINIVKLSILNTFCNTFSPGHTIVNNLLKPRGLLKKIKEAYHTFGALWIIEALSIVEAL